MDLFAIAQIAGGVILLIAGAESLVRGASRLAAAMGISPLTVGLTVVAYGTSAPELAVSLSAALRGSADIAVANVVGSNIMNLLFVLGLSAILAPLTVSAQVVRQDVPIMIACALAMIPLTANGRLGFIEGSMLTLGLVAYSVWVVRKGRREKAAVQDEYAQEFAIAKFRPRGAAGLARQGFFVFAGLALLVLGADWLVAGAVKVARAVGVSEVVIGLTIVAAGTSLPEAATSILATVRGERDIAIGNVIGSSIYNVLAILGLASLLSPGGLKVAPSLIAFDIPAMVAAAVASLPIFYTGYRIARWEGIVFLGYYGAYLLYLILAAARHDALPVFSTAMLLFILPLTAITLVVLTYRAYGRNRR